MNKELITDKESRLNFIKAHVKNKLLGGMSLAPTKEDEEEEIGLVLKNYDDGEIETGEDVEKTKSSEIVSKSIKNITKLDSQKEHESDYLFDAADRAMIKRDLEFYRKNKKPNS